MRARHLIAAVAVLMCQPLFGQTAAGIERAAWLQGCWEVSAGDRTVEEIRTRPRAGSMLGVSRTVQNGKLTAYETVVLLEQGDRLAYTAHPSGQPAATFLSTTVTTSRVVFENSTHDFPQQIGYEVKGDALLAWIAGTSNGKPRRIEFPYKRVGCADR